MACLYVALTCQAITQWSQQIGALDHAQPFEGSELRGEAFSMENAANFSRSIDASGSAEADNTLEPSNRRVAPRYNLLIRAATLISAQGEFVCVVRDVSETGVRIRLFHELPLEERLELEMPTGKTYGIEPVWNRGDEAGFTFANNIDTKEFVHEGCIYPKRPIRLRIQFPVRLKTLSHTCEAFVENLSQQGALLDTQAQFAIGQNVRIEGLAGAEPFGQVQAKVRWRSAKRCGVVFEDTRSLKDFARLAAHLQAPVLLDDQTGN